MLELHTPSEAANWLRARVTGTLRSDSRGLGAGDGFIAWPGVANDARQFVAAALASGTSGCLVEQAGAQAFGFADERVACYRQLKIASGAIAAEYFGQPSQRLKVLAVTGTNGKTSSAWWLAQALSNLKHAVPVSCGLVGTLGVGLVPCMTPAEGLRAGTPGRASALVTTGMTTPDPVRLQQIFADFVQAGQQACAIEASSIGLAEHRLQGTRIHTAIFTNFTQDHLDYHGSMESYWQAKTALFHWPDLQAAVINLDDARGSALAQSLQGAVLDLWTFSCTVPARLQASQISYGAQGLHFRVEEDSPQGLSCHELHTQLIGTYNVSNLLGVIAAMRSMGVPLAEAVASCAELTPVPGRMECVTEPGQPLVAVDYAHTPDALSKALQALKPLAGHRGGKLWCVFGCGGDRDAVKRPLMGAIAAAHADQVLVTSDNPRSEKPQAIISQILLGLEGHVALMVEPDRALAIALAVHQAAPQDVVLIAGKGHEDYQEVAGKRLPFLDLDHVRHALGRRGNAGVQRKAQS